MIRGKSRRRFAGAFVLAGALCLALVLSAATAGNRPVQVSDGKTQLVFNAGVGAQGLPAERWARVAFAFSFGVSSVDEGQPPAMRTLLVETDRRLAVNFKGLPACRRAQLQRSSAGEDSCEGAIVGAGDADFDNPQAHGPVAGGPRIVAYVATGRSWSSRFRRLLGAKPRSRR